jgi:hypothetical protein
MFGEHLAETGAMVGCPMFVGTIKKAALSLTPLLGTNF